MSQSLVRAISEAIPDPVFLKDVQGRWLFANSAMLRAVGRDLKGVLGRTDQEIYSDPAVAGAISEVDRRVLESGRTEVTTDTLLTPAGSRVFLSTKAPVRDGNGQVVALAGVARDVTDYRQAQQELRESEARFRGLVEHAPDIIYSFSEQRGGTYYSPRVEQVLGYTAQHLIEHPLLWQQSIHQEDLPRVSAAVEGFLAGGEFEVEYRIQTPQGGWRWLLDRSIGRRVGSGDTTIYGLATDITERKRVERSQRSQKRIQRVLTGCSEAVARAATERELLDTVCRQVVEEGEFQLCWIGWLQDDERRSIRAAARFGHDDGFIEALDAVWRDGHQGDTLASQAAGTSRLTVRREGEAEGTAGAWPEEARQRGFRAACALPLAGLGDVDGVLSIYSDDGDAFGDDDRALLERLAGTVAFGVAARRARAEQVRAEAELRRSREELRALAARLDTVREEEKTRISRDLHDEVGQLLTALRLDLDEVQARVEGLPVTAANGLLLDRVVDAGQLVARTVEATRHAVTLLRPVALDRLGLEAALRQECADFENRTGTPCAAEVSGADGLGPDGEIALFRIAQEALTNVVRHARARQVRVCLTRDRDEVVLQVADDGIGPARPGTTVRGLGIVGMRERAARLGGTFDVGPAPEGGTAVTVRLPLHPIRARETTH